MATPTNDMVLKERWELLERIGRGSQARTWLGCDLETGDDVVIKELRLSSAEDWKAIELFEREARVLENLEHPSIPTYLADFHVESDEGDRLFIVQSYVEGETLRSHLDRGPMQTSRALSITRELLETLVYLQSFSPPVIHRDIKPSNIIIGSGGDVSLVDFGGVRTILAEDTGGSTVIGTTGYMAPEQLMGRASAASDLYGVGATLVHMLTGESPADLPVERMELRWRDHASGLRDDLCDYVDRLIAPHAEDRFSRAKDALDALPETGMVSRKSTLPGPGPPRDSDIRVRRNDGVVEFWFPPSGSSLRIARDIHPVIIVFGAIAGLSVAVILALQAGMALAGGFVLLSLFISFVGLGVHPARKHPIKLRIDLQSRRYSIVAPGVRSKSGPLSEVGGVGSGVGRRGQICLATHHGLEVLSHSGTEQERRWLDRKVRAVVEDA